MILKITRDIFSVISITYYAMEYNTPSIFARFRLMIYNLFILILLRNIV